MELGKMDRDSLMLQLYESTRDIYQCITQIETDMDHDDVEKVENFYDMLLKRSEVLQEIEKNVLTKEIEWGVAENKKLEKIREWDLEINKKGSLLQQSFTSKYEKLHQGKKLLHRYQVNHSDNYSDGVYFDKKK
jgi:hypothetical protein